MFIFLYLKKLLTIENVLVPSQVTDISWKTINRTAVHVSWKEPRHINGILKGYTLSYTDNYNLPIEAWSEKVVPPPTCEIQVLNLFFI